MSSVLNSNRRGAFVRTFQNIGQAFLAAIARLDTSLSPQVTINKLRKHKFTPSDSVYLFNIALATFWITIMKEPGFPLKLMLPVLYTIALLIPLTSQFFLPATPIFIYLLTFYTSRFIPESYRPTISVSLLPTLETVLYGANISDILTRFTHPILDIIAWIPYGIMHFTFPFVVAAFIWLFRPPQVLHLFGRTFGYFNLLGVVIQILFPCSAPWYELIYGLTPANYAMKGSPGGLARIDNLFKMHGYTTAFSNSPVVFGAFPSLHAGCATMEALFLAHFFPHIAGVAWGYAAVMYWATMYLTHHYLIDVVSGACLATLAFYAFLPDDMRSGAGSSQGGKSGRSKYEVYDLEEPRGNGGGLGALDFDIDETSSDDEEVDITYRSPIVGSNRGGRGPPVVGKGSARRNHRHTASIASLIRGDERGAEDGWSPVGGSFDVR